MNDVTTIKVPRTLQRRIAERARRQHVTQAEVIEAALDEADKAAFWEAVERTMGTPEAQADLKAESERFAGALKDGLDPDEDWSDVPGYHR